MAPDCENNDSLVTQVLDELNSGSTREELARKYGYKSHASLDQYMRRRHYLWDAELENYVKSRRHPAYRESGIPNVPSKVEQIRLEFKSVTADAKDIARRLRFKDHKEMAKYMQSNGFVWSSDIHNYVHLRREETKSDDAVNMSQVAPHTNLGGEGGSVRPQVDWAKYLSTLEMLYEHRDKVVVLLGQTPSRVVTVPRYTVPGVPTIKSVHMISGLERMVRAFSDEKNISQREIFEVALIQFFYRYGYGNEMDELLSQ